MSGRMAVMFTDEYKNDIIIRTFPNLFEAQEHVKSYPERLANKLWIKELTRNPPKNSKSF